MSVSLLAILLAREEEAIANAPLTCDFNAAVHDNANELVDAFATTPADKA